MNGEVIGTYYVFVKENYFRPVKVEANNIEEAVDEVAEAVDKVAPDIGEGLPAEYHSTGHWTEWVVEDPTGTRHYHAIGEGYKKI